MSHESGAILERLLRENDLEWLIGWIAPPDESVAFLLKKLDDVTARYHSRVGEDVSFAPKALEEESKRNPYKVQAFLQAIASTRSAEMLVMVWRILQGLSIREVTMVYKEQKSFTLTVILGRPGDLSAQDQLVETYQSRDIDDAALLKHFATATMNSLPLFVGFYPLRLGNDPT